MVMRSTAVLMAGLAIGMAFSPVRAQDSEKISWSVTPYFWASDTALDLSIIDSEISGGTEVAFSDLLDVLDTAIQIHVEGGTGSWSGFGDLTFLETSDTLDRPLLVINTNSKQTVLDAALAYWPSGVGSRLNFFGGLRYTGFDDRYRFLLNEEPLVVRRSSKDYYDALVGLRYRFELSNRWAVLTRADASFGASEGTWLLQALLGYKVGKREQNRVLFGYQFKDAEFRDDGQRAQYSYDGPMAGFNFRF